MIGRLSIAKLDTWHAGEKAIQEKTGVAERMEVAGRRVVRDYMPDQHREFYAQIPFMALGSVDLRGDAWATFVTGRPGFVSSPSSRTLTIDLQPDPSDPASVGMRDGDAIGLLGIELNTRRRNRVNGILRATAGEPLGFDVDQSFGNCPQYIQLRDYRFVRNPTEHFGGIVEESAELDAFDRDMIQAADTFFVASYIEREDRRQVDVSHRGGKAGFVRINDDGTLTIPDFNGNYFFATLGNIMMNGKAGLAFVDFETGDVLQLAGDAKVILDSPEIAAFQGAERLWSFRARKVIRRRNAIALRWTFQRGGWSPASLMTGDWEAAADRLRAIELAARWRPFRVTKVVDESTSIRSFYLQPDDGAGGLPPYRAGQHLPIRIRLSHTDKPVIRTYTLSVAPSEGVYRISVKRSGTVSNYLHDAIRLGDLIEARAPDGHFTIDSGQKRPAVLIAGGIGITPMLAMLRHVVYEGLRTRKSRRTVLFQAAHSKRDLPFGKEIDELMKSSGGSARVVRVLSDIEGAEEGVDYDASGRVDIGLLSRFLPFDDYDFYLCGPPQFTQSLYDGLRRLNVADNRIHAEAFGPSSLTRSRDADAVVVERPPPSTQPVPVVFTKSLKEARWTPKSGTLLELAETRGLSPDFSCRTGTCGTCKTKLSRGTITYVKEPTATVARDEVLICCAVPAQPGGDEVAVIELAL
ncbi:pyridoxamine 5'-phosphate oxidase family protein [Bradyrhizobium sp. NBAIM14]|uniref:FAD-binding oxidoreductase n=1 Tax=Bradyrhizobium sp. NBAIM14 TaxID=2793814 RepID=UPI001CD3AE51|nr:pyridoxamine 5'-phosphate oxidase family protein [Bradyrhizobium sp. NBAIM14]MCA1500152.1 pyridoxamine 5'-phosphate oxidase family protein [Bradyrhizobium sp. NBAIM14]